MPQLTPQHQKLLDALLQDTIIPALFEDFEWESQEELDEAVGYLYQQMINHTDEKLVVDEEE